MIVRIWHGRTRPELADEYEEFLRRRAIPDYRGIAGNLGAFVLRQAATDRSEFLTVSFWESLEAIRAFAGDPIERAKYYAEDQRYLVEFEPAVTHYELRGAAMSDLSGVLAAAGLTLG